MFVHMWKLAHACPCTVFCTGPYDIEGLLKLKVFNERNIQKIYQNKSLAKNLFKIFFPVAELNRLRIFSV